MNTHWEIREGRIPAPWFGDAAGRNFLYYAAGFIDGRIGWLDLHWDEAGLEKPPARLLDRSAEVWDDRGSVSGQANRLHARLEDALTAYGTDPRGAFRGLPLILLGSDWQRRVWKALLEIPAGSTSTYGRLAERLGSPRSARAVGAAASVNPIMLIVPCHRLIASSGLGGYAGGVDYKRALLRHEGAVRTFPAAPGAGQ